MTISYRRFVCCLFGSFAVCLSVCLFVCLSVCLFVHERILLKFKSLLTDNQTYIYLSVDQNLNVLFEGALPYSSTSDWVVSFWDMIVPCNFKNSMKHHIFISIIQIFNLRNCKPQMLGDINFNLKSFVKGLKTDLHHSQKVSAWHIMMTTSPTFFCWSGDLLMML